MKERESPVEYKVMDMLNMDEIADNSVDFIVDKGSLDALCCDSTPETQEKVKKYFSEVSRVLADDGTYIGVSLLQDFVFDAYADYFSRGNGNRYAEDFILDFRIRRIEKIEASSFVPFLVTVKNTKIDKANEKFSELRKKLANTITFSESRMIKAEVLNVDQAKVRIKREQMTSMFTPRMRELALG